MPSATLTTFTGLITNMNSNDVPPGAMTLARNVAFRRPRVIEHRRCWSDASSAGDNSGKQQMLGGVVTPSAMFQKSGIAYMQTSDNKVWSLTGQTVASTPTILFQNVSFEAFNSAFVCTASGWRKYALAPTGTGVTPPSAGAPRALDASAALTVSAVGWFQPYYAVAYRYVWNYIDANGQLLQGVPSSRLVVVNGASQSYPVLTLPMPSYFQASVDTSAGYAKYFVQVYRTTAVVGSVSSPAPDPGDSEQLVYEYPVQAADITNGFVTVTDLYPETILKGADLYTNTSEEGFASANFQPPPAKFAAFFKGSAFYAYPTPAQRTTLTMLGVPTAQAVVSTTWDAVNRRITYTLAAGFNYSGLSGCPVSVSGCTNASNNGDFFYFSSVPASNTLTVQLQVAQPDGVAETAPAGALLVSSVLTVTSTSSRHFYASIASGNRFSTAGYAFYVPVYSGTPSQQIRGTCAALAQAINGDSSCGLWAYNSGGAADAPGLLEFEERGFGVTGQPSVVCSPSDAALKWAPVLSVAKSLQNDSGAATGIPNRVYVSPAGQPEAVPLGNYYDLGNRSDEIRSVLATRDYVFILTKRGAYRFSGDAVDGWVVERIDTTLCALTATVMRNEVYALTNRGVVRIGTAGVQVVSGAVQNIVSWRPQATAPLPGPAWASDEDGSVTFQWQHYSAWTHGQTEGTLTYYSDTNCWATETAPTEALGVLPGSVSFQGPTSPLAFSMMVVTPYATYGYDTNTNRVMVRQDDTSLEGIIDTPWAADSLTAWVNHITTVGVDPHFQFVIEICTSGYTPRVTDVLIANGDEAIPMVVTAVRGAQGSRPGWEVTCEPASWAALAGDLAFITAFNIEAITVLRGVDAKMQFYPFNAGNDGAVKHFTEVAILLDPILLLEPIETGNPLLTTQDAATGNSVMYPLGLGWTTNNGGGGGTITVLNETDELHIPAGGEGSAFVGFGSGKSISLGDKDSPPFPKLNGPGNGAGFFAGTGSAGYAARTLVPMQYRRSRRCTLRFEHSTPLERLCISGIAYHWREYDQSGRLTEG